MAAVRSRLQTTGLSPEVCKILLASWRTSTQKRYEGSWQQWASWCLEMNKCPFSAPVADVLDFLSEQFNNRNLAYRTVGVYKACISQMHDPVDGLQLGSLLLVSRFMKGIFQLRPATPMASGSCTAIFVVPRTCGETFPESSEFEANHSTGIDLSCGLMKLWPFTSIIFQRKSTVVSSLFTVT